MQLCVAIAQTQLGPDKDLGRLSLLWLQRAQASHKGAVAHFMQKLLQSNAPAPAIVEYKALQASLTTNVWKYVYEARDLLRKDIIVATVRLDRSAKANTQLTTRNSALQARIQQLEDTVTDFEKEARESKKTIASLEKKLTKAQKDVHRAYEAFSGYEAQELDSTYGSTDFDAQERTEQRQAYYDEAYLEAESEISAILTEEAEAEARAIDAAIEKDQNEELQRVADHLDTIQELVDCEAADKKKKKKRLKKKNKKASSTEGGSSSSSSSEN